MLFSGKSIVMVHSSEVAMLPSQYPAFLLRMGQVLDRSLSYLEVLLLMNGIGTGAACGHHASCCPTTCSLHRVVLPACQSLVNQSGNPARAWVLSWRVESQVPLEEELVELAADEWAAAEVAWESHLAESIVLPVVGTAVDLRRR